jgi:hypothetical protein
MFFNQADMFHFPSFGCHLVPQLGSSRQKCGPDRCDQNSHKSRLCFFTQQTFSIFMPLIVTWGPSLDPCGKSVILTSAIKIHIKVVRVFLHSRHFPFSFLWLSLGVPTWILAAEVSSWQVRSKFTLKLFMAFYPSDIFHVHSFGCHLVSQLGSLRQTCDGVIDWKELSVGRRCCGKVSFKSYTTPPRSKRFAVGRRHPFAHTNIAKNL